ncbi:unnamed protein product [Cylindrotheca closterium]|uniref:Uncharacterized protein n=1 Tax=Cylindrotheca closterium TaxID=2856 RepID=A0AAD2GCU2_9STRA|nr:unnamed protein product [Cylindrotheca closterium]
MNVATAPATAIPRPAAPKIARSNLNGVWKLDKTKGQWHMRGYLQTLQVNELAIQAHEKGESDQETYHSISLEDTTLKIIKRSRVNNDLVVELNLGEEKVEYLQPGERPKKSLATTENPATHLRIDSSLLTMNGMAHVTDIKRLVEDGTMLFQELTILNEQTGARNITTRYFVPEETIVLGRSNLADQMED